jgi:hypothetical protein
MGMRSGFSTTSLGWVGLLTLTFGLSACSSTPTADKRPLSKHERADRQARVPNEYLVILAEGAEADSISERFSRFGIKDLHPLEGETYLLVLVNDPGPGEMLDLVQGDKRFRTVQPNIIDLARRARNSR